MFLKTATKMDRKNKSLNGDGIDTHIDADIGPDNELASSPIAIQNRSGLVKSIAIALIIHFVFFGIIAWFWQQASEQKQQSLIVSPEPIKINSYIITTEQYEAMVKASELVKPLEGEMKIDADKQEINKEEINEQEVDKQDTNTEVEESIQPITPSVEHQSVSHIQPQVPSVPPDIIIPRQPDSSSNSRTSAINDETVNEAVSDSVAVLSTHAITQASTQYLQQMNINELDTLVGTQSALTSKPAGTMSEMDPDLVFIELIPQIDTSQPHTYNHRLDPNRIVKQGDYCYRVVNLATQVNPYGEGLGYAEFCGVDDQKTALTNAISNRLSKIK
ncbi:hypothetical protein ACRWQL_01930 [Shewanella sp. HL-SH4]|uniref:hypothetical protein n=1 Tax=Shewanella sp. HL-SH4 TaxID=3436240 RepID=UPI003EB820EA